MNFKKASWVLLLISGLILILVGVPRLVLNTWLPFSNYLFYLSLILVFSWTLFNYKIIADFFTMKTTKYGMNMGTLIFLGLLLFLGLNFLGTRYEVSKDITLDKLNSLSLQSMDIVKALDSKVEFLVYYQGDIHKSQNIALKLLFKKYQRESDKISTNFIDAHKDPNSVQFLTENDKGKVVVILKDGEKTERAVAPFDEDTITSALFRLESKVNKVVYFSTGHGERSLKKSAQEGASLSQLAATLKSKGFKVKELNFLGIESVPEDAAMIAVVGARKSFLEFELNILNDYLKKGSARLFFAVDPTSEADFSSLLSRVGVKVDKTFVLTTEPIAGGDALAVAAQDFNQNSKITNKLEKNSLALFYEASELTALDSQEYEVEKLISSLPTMIPVTSLKSYQEEVKGVKPKSVVLALQSELKDNHEGHDHSDENIDLKNTDLEKKSKIIVFGDSDFLTDLYITTVFNKDLALNSFAYLSNVESLISIQPKVSKKTELILTSVYSAFIIIFPIFIPLVTLLISSILWFRKRSA